MMYLMEESREESGKARITQKQNRDVQAGGIIKVLSPLVRREKQEKCYHLTLCEIETLWDPAQQHTYPGPGDTHARRIELTLIPHRRQVGPRIVGSDI